jgi:hypothetical protein
MKLNFLKKFREYNRNKADEQLNTMLYSSSNTLNAIETDLRNGGKINNPVELTIHKGKALLTEGNHRLAAAENAGFTDVPCKIIIKGKLNKDLQNRYNKFKTL